MISELLRVVFFEQTYELMDGWTDTMCETNNHLLAVAWWINNLLSGKMD